MAIGEGTREAIQLSKEQQMDGGVLDVQERTVTDLGDRNTISLSVNITDFGRRIHQIQGGDEVSVVIHEDGIWIQPVDE